MTDRALRRLYLKLNRDWFDDMLPTDNVHLVFVDSRESGRWTYWSDDTFDICIVTDLRGRPWAVGLTLMHEMIHMYCHMQGANWVGHLTHGPVFQQVKQDLMKRGAFDKYI